MSRSARFCDGAHAWGREPLARADAASTLRRSAPGRDWGVTGEASSRPGALLRGHGLAWPCMRGVRHRPRREPLARAGAASTLLARAGAASTLRRSAPGRDWGVAGKASSRPGALLRGHGVARPCVRGVRHRPRRELLARADAASTLRRSAPGRDRGVTGEASSRPGALLRGHGGCVAVRAWSSTPSAPRAACAGRCRIDPA